MRSLLPLLCLPLLILLVGCPRTPDPAPKATSEPPPAADVAPTESPGLPGTRHSQSDSLKDLHVTFSSPLLTGEVVTVPPATTVPIEQTLCNLSDTPMEGVSIQLHTGSFAQVGDAKYSQPRPLSAPLAPADNDCAANATTLTIPIITTESVEPNTAVSVSPVLVVQWDGQVETFECPFKIHVRLDAPVPATPE